VYIRNISASYVHFNVILECYKTYGVCKYVMCLFVVENLENNLFTVNGRCRRPRCEVVKY